MTFSHYVKGVLEYWSIGVLMGISDNQAFAFHPITPSLHHSITPARTKLNGLFV